MLLGNEGVQEVCQTGGVHSGHKQAGEVVWHVGEAWNLVVPGHHAAGGIVYIVIKDHALQSIERQTWLSTQLMKQNASRNQTDRVQATSMM